MADAGRARIVHRVADGHLAGLRCLQVDHRAAVVQVQVALQAAQRIADHRRALHQHRQQSQAGEVEALAHQQPEVLPARSLCGIVQQLRRRLERHPRAGMVEGRCGNAAAGEHGRRVDTGVEQQAGHRQQRRDAEVGGRGIGLALRCRAGHEAAADRRGGATIVRECQ
jgi:hypothetical protein